MSLISHLLILLSYALIAEKVETERMVAELLDLNVDFGQGYLFGEPRHARKIAA